MATDRNLTCADCGQEFVFTANEQDFYTERGFSDPRRCPACRQARKAQRGTTTGSAGGYSSGGSRSYSDRPPREMFEATCSSCGQVAKVPFRPTSGKPVYCTDCFAKRRA